MPEDRRAMEADVAVQYVIRGLSLLGGGLVLALFATWFVGWLCRRAAVPSGLTLLAQIATPVALFYVASLSLDVAGHVVQARVASTEEKISHRLSGPSIPGAWSRSFWATVSFDAPDGPQMAPLWIDETTYDALQPGAPIVVRYFPWLPMIARPADQSTRAFVPWRWLAVGIVVLGAVLALRPILRRVPAAPRAAGILATVVIVVVCWVFPTPWETPLDPPILTATAEVLGVREETRSFTSGDVTGSVPAPQPWHIVELSFVPEGREKAVIAVDSVDVGSVAGLQVGARLPVSYNARNPRDARLAGARTWRRKEWGELGAWIVTAVMVTAGFVLLTKVASAWWRRLMSRS
jgi:hypothetical protein